MRTLVFILLFLDITSTFAQPPKANPIQIGKPVHDSSPKLELTPNGHLRIWNFLVDDAFVASLKDTSKARTLDLLGCTISEGAMRDLSALPNLTSILISHCRFDDKPEGGHLGWPPEFATKLEKIRSISIEETYLGEGRLKWDESFPSLEYAHLKKVGIGDRDLKRLLSIKNLTELRIEGNNISDASERVLASIKTTPLVFGIFDNLLSEEVLAKLDPMGNKYLGAMVGGRPVGKVGAPKK